MTRIEKFVGMKHTSFLGAVIKVHMIFRELLYNGTFRRFINKKNMDEVQSLPYFGLEHYLNVNFREVPYYGSPRKMM